MSENILIRPMERGDVPGCVDLIAALFSNRRPDGYFIWQLFENVFPVVCFGAFADGRLVGMFAVQKRTMTDGRTAGQIISMNIHPGWAGRGLLKKISAPALAAFDDLDFVCIFVHNEKSVGPGRAAFGLTFPEPLSSMELDARGFVSATSLGAEEVTDVTAFPEAGSAHGARLGLAATRGFRRWRFGRAPVYKYKKLTLDENAFTIVKTVPMADGAGMYGDIVDLECDSEDAEGAKVLLSGAVAFLAKSGATQIATWATPGSVVRRTLEGLGFKPGFKSYFGFKALNGDAPGLDTLSSWHFRQGDAPKY
ncbi:MAG: GNAT family N-acetyltransferase [Nitrospinae bacterium]|nr:GNAT family N-acetyltransferase [Nitrospinota bacterium]